MKNSSAYQDNRYFQTSSFYAAAFLSAKDQTLIDVDKATDPKRAQFVFLNTPELETLLHNYNFAQEGSPETLIDFRKAVAAIKAFSLPNAKCWIAGNKQFYKPLLCRLPLPFA